MEERSKQKLSEWADWVEFELTRKEAFLLGQTCLQGGVGGGGPRSGISVREVKMEREIRERLLSALGKR